MSIPSFEQHFPFSVIRKEQRNAIDFALNAFLNENKRVVILEMGPGCGKSVTGITIARTLQAMHELRDPRVLSGGTHIMTTQKVLQEQYIRDFGGTQGPLKQIKSSGSYCCQFFEDRPEMISCGEIQRLLKSKARCGIVYKACEQQCKFRQAKTEFLNSPEGITNYAYYLTSSTYTQELTRCGLLIMDEGHNIENALGGFVKIAFSNFFYRTVLGVKTPAVNASQETVYKWLVNTCRPKLNAVIRDMQKKIERTDDSTVAIKVSRELETLQRNMSRIDNFIDTYDPDTWVIDVSKSDKRGERIYEFKPVDVASYAQRLLFSNCDRALVLSATILDKSVYCQSVGLKESEVAFLRIPSPFPPQNRPVHYVPVGSMSKERIEQTLPIMVEAIKMLLAQHPNDKGIIHAVNYRISKYLIDAIGPKRLVTHDNSDREEVIKFHCTSKEPTVLVSPSMMEGVDLADDMSRFQILCKVPFPYLGDAAVKKRMIKSPQWYPYQAVKSVVQALGRSIRNETDHATSYILDSDWERFFKNNSQMFPEEFSTALV